MSTHALNLLGGFDLRDDRGDPITVRSRKSRCLLAYLALAQGQQKHRDVLAELLWGDRGDAQARRSLSQELYRLRGLFPEEAQAGFDLSSDTVGIAADLLDIDVVRFERGLDTEEPQAAALYTGELLAGLGAGSEGFDGWLRDERERLRDRAIAAWHDVLRVQITGPADPAIESASRLLALDPTSEEAHRALMELYEKTGRRDLALRQYKKCAEALSAELGIKPDASTRALHERISAAPQTKDANADKPGTIESAPNGEVAMIDQPLLLPSKPSIAVLPFSNMSGDPEQEYFSDGIADDIITGLSRFGDLFVISRNSSFTYKGAAVDIKRVGRELGVRYVLEGSVRKAGNRVRINAQLIEAETDNHLWADKYDGDLTDIFDLQDEITASVVGAVQPTVFLAEIERVRRKHPENLDAYELCMRGWAHEIQFDKQGFLEARKCFLKAIELDERLARAYIGLARAYFWEAMLGWSENPEHNMAEASRAAKKAVAIDEADSEAHEWAGWISTFFPSDLDAALAEINRAVELGPNNARARGVRGAILCFNGRPEEGAEEVKTALRLSPRDRFRFFFFHELALCQYTARDYAAAAESAMNAIALKPDYLYAHWHLAGSCAQLGQTERARAALGEILRVNPNFDRAFVESVAPYRNPADLEHLMEGLRKAGWDG